MAILSHDRLFHQESSVVKAIGCAGLWSCRPSVFRFARQIDRIAWRIGFQSRRSKGFSIGPSEWYCHFDVPSLDQLILGSKWRETHQGASPLAPFLQVLLAKVLRAFLVFVSFAIALSTVGLDLSSFALLGGAIGVGIGFGLQKVVSNLVSGLILLIDRSIKPGDVIEIEGTYGWINSLRARYASIITRDGKEHLIPNEDLITNRVINWSFSDRKRAGAGTIGNFLRFRP